MRYLILGPLEVRDGSRIVALGKGRQRVLLALLAIHRNEVLSADRLIDALWSESPPASAVGSLHNLISALRKTIGDGQIVTHGHGYALMTDAVDAAAFEALAARGRATDDPGQAAARLSEALALWRGPALGELAYDLPAAAARLDDLRLSALEDRIEADLALGRHAALVAELAELVEGHPERERLRGHQMLALYRCGRQADALAAYRDLRRRLADELGLSPAPALRALEQAILEHDPALDPPGRAAAPLRPRRRHVLALVTLGVVAAIVATLVHDGPSPSAGRPPPAVAGDALAAIDLRTNRVVARYPVGATPASAGVGGGAAWTVNADAQTLTRIDLRDHSTRTFATGSVPLELAAGADGVWLVTADGGAGGTTFAGAPAALTRVDPATTAVSLREPLRPSAGPVRRGPPGLVALSEDAVWAVGRTGRLLRMDRRGGTAAPVAGIKALTVAAGDGEVWAAIEAAPTRPNLVRLDPADGRVLERVHVPWASLATMAVGAGALWLADPYGGVVWRLDLQRTEPPRTVAVEYGVDSIAASDDAVWAGDAVARSVSRIDVRTRRVVARLRLDGTPRAIALGAGRVWVAIAGGDGGTAALPSGAPLRALRGCGPVLTAPGVQPTLLVAVELPLQGQFAATSRRMIDAIVSVLRAHHFRATWWRLALQVCDDSIAQSGQPDATKCATNAHAYAAHTQVIGVIGPMHSFCAQAMLPILNRAGVALVSPTNSDVALVRPGAARRRLYPAGQHGYARVYPSDDTVMEALVRATQGLGVRRAFFVEGQPTSWRTYFRQAARRLGLALAGAAQWDPDATSFRALARRVRASGAQAVIVNGSAYMHVGRVIRDLRATLGPDFPVLATESALPITQLFADAGDAARGVHIVVGGLPPAGLDATGRRFLRTQGPGVPQFAVYAAAAAEVMWEAIRRGLGTRASVVRSLAETRLAASPIGPIVLDRRGEPELTHATVVRAERDGAPVYIDGIDGGVVERVLTMRSPR